MNEWIQKPWTLRWWRIPGEALLSQSFEGKQAIITFTWCNDNEWGLDFSLDGGHPEHATFHIDLEDISGAESMPGAVVAATLDQLKRRARGIREGVKPLSEPVLNSIAEQLPSREWVTGRRLRKLTGLDVEVFNQHLARLMPRYVRRYGIEEDDQYSLTLPGLVAMDAKLQSIALMECLYQAIAHCYERDEDAIVFENSDLIASGITQQDIAVAHTIAKICLLGSGGARTFRLPADREMIAAQAKKKVHFLEYLHRSATERQRNAHYTVKRPWLQAPLWAERDGSQPDYQPIDFLPTIFPSASVEPAMRAEASASEDFKKVIEAVQLSEAQPQHLLPRLDVEYGEKLGDGAFGTVWEATDKLLERKLAVKFLTSTDEALDERALLRQARSLAKITHPNLVAVHCAAWLPHPRTGLVAPAIMMELLEGTSLLQWASIQQERESVLRVAAGLFNGISAMHAAGLHHGDLHANNVLVLPSVQAKVIDWRYQDTFLAKSTASRNELVEADQRRAIDQIVSLFEKQGMKEESLELRHATDLAEAQAMLERFGNAPLPLPLPPVASPTSLMEVGTFPPDPLRLDLSDVNEKETCADQSELAIWPTQQSDLDVSELMAELDVLVRNNLSTIPIRKLFNRHPISTEGKRRWSSTYRPFTNVLQKCELEARDGGFLAFRWAKFTTLDPLLYDTQEFLDAVVVSIHLYELAVRAAARAFGGAPVERINLRLTVAGSAPLLLRDNANITNFATYSPKSDAKWRACLEARLPSTPGSIAARLINRALSHFQFQQEHFADQHRDTLIVRLDPTAYDRYLQTVIVKKVSG
jgi:RIO-like serine/threonine protein kinase